MPDLFFNALSSYTCFLKKKKTMPLICKIMQQSTQKILTSLFSIGGLTVSTDIALFCLQEYSHRQTHVVMTMEFPVVK